MRKLEGRRLNNNGWLNAQIDELAGSPGFETERLFIRITEALVARLIHLGITKSELARRMDVDRSVVTRALSGDQNMTIRTMVSMASALGCRINFGLQDVQAMNARSAAGSTAGRQRQSALRR